MFESQLAALLPLPRPRINDPLLRRTVSDMHSLAVSYILDPLRPLSEIHHVTDIMRTRCSPWLVRVLGALTEAAGAEDGADDDEHAEAESTVAKVAELIALLAGRAALKDVTRQWEWPRAGRMSVREPSFGDADLGFQTWGSGIILARLLDSGAIPVTHDVLELGSGTGMAGMVAARMASMVTPAVDGQGPPCSLVVTVTDYHPVVLSNLAWNVRANGLEGTAQVRKLDWTAALLEDVWSSEEPSTIHKPTEGDGAPIMFKSIIASDCVYDQMHVEKLPGVIDKFLAPGPDSRFYCVLPNRPRFESERAAFLVAMNLLGLVEEEDNRIADREVVGELDQIEYLVLCYRRV
ncbi:hypothetical protein HKX48_001119 [Thoreauomyces humboldtii]|nr:hypothetical protein HKX48_001119 [Thoreauomyces humboldtii]